MEDCSRRSVSRGYCAAHYSRWVKRGDVRADKPLRALAPVGDVCEAADCGEAPIARGMCRAHYHQRHRTISPDSYKRSRELRDDRKRASQHGARFEDVDRAAVFTRDGWICGICGDRIDRSLRWPDPMSPSLDHIHPLSRGGAHAADNCQAAHLGCNIHKGSRVVADRETAGGG